MILPCEVAVKSVVPAVRAMLAQELVIRHGLTQDKVAEILGLSQSAVSKYSTKTRGHVINIENVEEVRPLINGVVNLLANGAYERSAFLRLFCDICIAVRKTSVMCTFCRKSSPNLKIEECGFCTGHSQGEK